MTRRRWSLATTVLAVLVAAATLAGCGVPTDAAPRDIAPDAVPKANDPGSASSSNSTALEHAVEQPVYVVRATDKSFILQPVNVQVAQATNPGEQAQRLIEALVRERNEQLNRRDATLQNKVPFDIVVSSAELRDDGVLVVDFNKELGNIENDLLRYAVAQIVFTATRVPAVKGVVIKVDGQVRGVPLEEATGTAEAGRPITRRDYPTLNDQVQSSESSPGEG